MLQVKKNPSLDALLSDVCIATSAAPTYLPAHYFQTKDPSGKVKEFNLIDGGIAANNPVYTNLISYYHIYIAEKIYFYSISHNTKRLIIQMTSVDVFNKNV